VKASRQLGLPASLLFLLSFALAGCADAGSVVATGAPQAASSTPKSSPKIITGPLTFDPKPGDAFIEDLDGCNPALTMVWIPGGKFVMGNDKSPEELVKIFGDNERSFAKEYPAHEVELDGFWMATFMVTNQQYKRFDPKHTNQRGPDQELDAVPVLQVSWADATAFCEWLSNAAASTTACRRKRSSNTPAGRDRPRSFRGATT
jgi:formylglycine-generating enzyme required for sulfatase activity